MERGTDTGSQTLIDATVAMAASSRLAYLVSYFANPGGDWQGALIKYLLEHRTLNNWGVVQWSGGGDLYAGGATVNNEAGGVWDIQGDESVRAATGGSVFNNDGTLQKSGGSGTSTIESTFMT